MILTGKSERAAKALRLGLVDELVPPSILRATALAAARPAGAGRRARSGEPTGGLRASSSTAPRSAGGWSTAAPRRRCSSRPAATTRRRSPRSRRCGSGWSTASPPGSAEEHRAFGAARRERRLPQAGADLLRHHRAQEGRRRPARHRDRRGRSAGSASSARASWAPGIAGHRGAQRRGGHPAQGRRPRPGRQGAQGAARDILDERLKRRRITRPQYDRLSALLSGGDDYRRLLAAPTW